MKKQNKIELNASLDKNRSVRVERIIFGNNEPLFWLELTNTQTDSVYRLPALRKADIKKINDLITDLDNFENL